MGNLIQLAGPIATIVAAGAACYVAWTFGKGQLRIAEGQKRIAQQQARLADVRLQHDLFDRRIQVFDAARDLVLAVFHRNDVSDEEWMAFIRGTEKSVFLFQKPINDYITELRNRGAALRFVIRQLPNVELTEGDGRREFARVREEHVQWFQQQFDVLIPVFAPALALERDIDTRLTPPEQN